MTNPLDDLTSNPTLPAPPRQHSSGRREFRHQFYSRGIQMHHNSATEEEKLAILKTGQPANVTRPIRNKTKRLTRAEKKAAKRERNKSRKAAD